MTCCFCHDTGTYVTDGRYTEDRCYRYLPVWEIEGCACDCCKKLRVQRMSLMKVKLKEIA